MSTPIRITVRLSAAATVAFLAGCGADLNAILYETATAAGQTLLDRLLTDVANDAAHAFDRDEAPLDDGGDDDDVDGDDDDDGDGGEPTDGSPFAGLVGDPAAGSPLFASCGSCHCPDATGGCLLDAPALVGVGAETLDEFLRGQAVHSGGSADLTDQEIVDLEAFLAPVDGLTGDPAAGEAFFASCAACHCPDAAGGCLPSAPSIVGVDAGLLDEQLRGDSPHSGGKFDLTDTEIADIEAYLASL